MNTTYQFPVVFTAEEQLTLAREIAQVEIDYAEAELERREIAAREAQIEAIRQELFHKEARDG